MTANYEEKNSVARISEEALISCIASAVEHTEGVHALAERIGDSLSKSLLRKESYRKGIKLFKGEKGPAIDVFVIVQYGVHIPEVAWNIQDSVKNALACQFDLPVEAVNIRVQGICAAVEGNN